MTSQPAMQLAVTFFRQLLHPPALRAIKTDNQYNICMVRTVDDGFC